MSACPECAKAQTDGFHYGRYKNCADCDIRALATGTRAVREAALDHFNRWLGPAANAALKQRIADEWERIKALRGYKR